MVILLGPTCRIVKMLFNLENAESCKWTRETICFHKRCGGAMYINNTESGILGPVYGKVKTFKAMF